jgi:AcrR family transcriptional regulator
VAQRARGSPQTVYNVIGGKAALFKAVYDVAVAGDDEPVPIRERTAFAEIAAAEDVRTCLTLYARLGRQMYRRAGVLVSAPFVEGTGGDPELQAFIDTLEQERRTGTAGTARLVAARFGLSPGLTEAEAADVLWTLTAPEVADRLVRRCGWSLDRYETWLARMMIDALVG